MLLRSQEKGSFTFHRREDHPGDGCCYSSGHGLTMPSLPGSGESYWDLVLQRMGHPVLPVSQQQKLCPSLKIKLPGSVEPKSTGSFSVDTQVEQHRAPSLQLTQNNDSWQRNLFCTCLISVDMESLSSNLCFHQVKCFCMLNFDSVFFKYANNFFLTTGTGLT